jgi:hypothetical protein
LASKKIESNIIWASYIKDLEQHIEDKVLDMYQIFMVIRSLYAVEMLDESLATGLIQYLMKKGYTATDLFKLSSPE